MNPGTRLVLLSRVAPSMGSVVTVACGNSICAQNAFGAGGSAGWNWSGELHVANTLAGSPLRFSTITASTRSDRYGVYGYSGQLLATINADIALQWIGPINTAGVVPDLVVGLALLENDIASDRTVAQMTGDLEVWISAVQAAWPTAKILLCTPRPSTSYNTPTRVSNYQAMRAYTLGRAAGRKMFAVNTSVYEDPANPGIPLAGYTDATVHPNAAGAMALARAEAPVLVRISRGQQPFTSTRRALTGSVSATGTGVSGTMPTGCGFAGSASATQVSTALQPGWSVVVSTPVGADKTDIGTFNTGAGSASSPALVSAFARVRIVAGGENLRNLQLDPRIQDGGGNTFRNYLVLGSLDVDPGFQTGDVLTFVSPPMPPNSGAISAVQNYIRPMMKNTTASATIEVIESGYYTVA